MLGVYDSGIGGLTTLAKILKNLGNADVLYFSDNLHAPFGQKSAASLAAVATDALNCLKSRCRHVVVACNTASSLIDDADVIRLLPPLPADSSSLLMATKGTMERLGSGAPLKADTRELATLIEREAENTYADALNFDALKPYLHDRLDRFKGVKNVILGCSHYPYVKKQIRQILGQVSFFDGDMQVLNGLCAAGFCASDIGGVSFHFTANDESEKYRRILSYLMAEQS